MRTQHAALGISAVLAASTIAGQDILVASRNTNEVIQINSSGAPTFVATTPLPGQIVMDSLGRVFIGNTGGNNAITLLDTDGTVSFFATGISGLTGLAIDDDDVLYAVASATGEVLEIDGEANQSLFAQSDLLLGAQGAAIDADGNLFIANSTSGRILRIDPAGVVSEAATLAGGPIFALPDEQGRLYVSLFNASQVVRVEADSSTTFIATVPSANMSAFAPTGELIVTGFSTNLVHRISDLDGNPAVSTVSNSVLTPNGALFIDSDPACPPDLDLNGAIDSSDLNILLGGFGCTGYCPGDVNGDNATDSTDLNLLLGAFGTPCP